MKVFNIVNLCLINCYIINQTCFLLIFSVYIAKKKFNSKASKEFGNHDISIVHFFR